MKNCFSAKSAAFAVSMLLGSTAAFGHAAGENGTATTGYLRDSGNHPDDIAVTGSARHYGGCVY